MKKVVLSLLIFLISFANSYETIGYFLKVAGTSADWVSNFHCEEKSEDPEESVKKTEMMHFANNDIYLNNSLICSTNLSNVGSKQNINFSSADYSQEVYSPPENL